MKTMKSTTCRKRHAERGAALLELAFILPLLVIMVLGVIDLGRLIHARLVVTNISREGGSLASRGRGGTDANLLAMLQSSATPFDLANQGPIHITEIGAQDSTATPPRYTPISSAGFKQARFPQAARLWGAENGPLQSGLSSVMVNHLTENPQTGTTDISGSPLSRCFITTCRSRRCPALSRACSPITAALSSGAGPCSRQEDVDETRNHGQ